MKDKIEKKEKKHSLKGNPLLKLLLLLLLLASLVVSAYGVVVAAASYAYNTRYEGKMNVLHKIYDQVGYADAVQVYQRSQRWETFDSLINQNCNFDYEIHDFDGTIATQSNPNLIIDPEDYRTLYYQVASYTEAVPYETVVFPEGEEDGPLKPGTIYGVQKGDVIDYYIESFNKAPDYYIGHDLQNVFNLYIGGDEIGKEGDCFLVYQEDGPYYIETLFSEVYLFIDLSKGVLDRYYVIDRAVEQMYMFGYWALLFTAAGLALSMFFIVMLCGMAGRYGKEGELKDNFLSKLWLEIPIAVIACLTWLVCFIIAEMGERLITIPVALSGISALVLCLVLLIMNIAHKIKVGRFWNRTLLGLILISLGKGIAFVGKSFWHLIMSMRLMGRTALAALIFVTAAIIVIVSCYNENDSDAWATFCSLAVIAIVILMFVVSYMLKKLQRGIDNLASGNFNDKTDTKHLFPTFKTAAEKINVASDGMNKAVEERIKSERMRTELITNVSHDIKTPLTSIINYSDLILSEQVENEKVTEYAEILHRQGERLKRLLEDLLEASKASTGNLEVVLGPCALNVLVAQVAAEYEEKFASAGLKLVTELPEQESTILADGRRLSRVLDNLLNNACKYSLTGTRVYMTVDVNDEFGRIIIKNTSKSELNVSPDELMERFVRGDSSRTTEGSGLGLSIAQSLTELQGGKLTLAIDGDLFKAIVCMKRDTIHS